jgi:peroxiredoxin
MFMDKGTKIIIVIAVCALLLMLSTFGYDIFFKKDKPQVQSLLSSSLVQDKNNSAPDFTVQDADGNNVSLSDFKGKPVVLNIWVSWCPFCKAEMPDYENMYREYKAKGVIFMMINQTDGKKETTSTAKKFLKENNYTFTAFFDTKYAASEAFGVSTIPDSFFINKDGKIVSEFHNSIDASTIKKNIEAILK